MAQSRKDKSRKQKQTNFKNKNKSKSMAKAPDVKPFRQVPSWNGQETFEIQGSELEALYNYFNIVAPAFTAIQQVFARGIQSNKIKIGYEHEDGTPVEDAEIKQYTQTLQKYFEERMKEQGVDPKTAGVEVAPDEAPQEVEANAPKILNLHGAPVTNEG